MLIRFLLALSVLFYSPVYGVVNVPVYGVFNFNTATLSIFWNVSKLYDSYLINLYKETRDTSNIRCDSPVISTLQATTSAPISSQSVNFSGLELTAEYRAEILGVKGTSKTLLASQTFWIHLITQKIEVGWCLDDSTSSMYEYTGYKLYNAEIPSHTFTNNEDLVDWKVKVFTKEYEYGYKANNVMTAVARPKGSTSLIESPASAQLIMYSVLPRKPIWDGFEN